VKVQDGVQGGPRASGLGQGLGLGRALKVFARHGTDGTRGFGWELTVSPLHEFAQAWASSLAQSRWSRVVPAHPSQDAAKDAAPIVGQLRLQKLGCATRLTENNRRTIRKATRNTGILTPCFLMIANRASLSAFFILFIFRLLMRDRA